MDVSKLSIIYNKFMIFKYQSNLGYVVFLVKMFFSVWGFEGKDEILFVMFWIFQFILKN